MVKEEHDKVDVLINNAGVNLDQEYLPANVKATIDTNYRGTLNVGRADSNRSRYREDKSDCRQMCQTFVPTLSKRGRIVNISSTGSSLSGYSKEIQERFRSSKMTLADLEQMMNEYQEAANNGTESRNGWKTQAYGVTKAATNAMTAVLARANPGLTINACCPGWVDTDMGNMLGRPPKTPGT
ncbi:MAG: hypothetical protein Q9179_006853 [Wetmoreana sp. 5 TL-2023]